MPTQSPSSETRARRPRRGRDSERAPRRESEGWIYGIHPVREALRARRRRLERVRLRDGAPHPELEAIVQLAAEHGVPVERVPRPRLDEGLPPGVQSQGVALEAGPLPELGLRDWLAAGASQADRWIVALDGVEDPQNVGAIARVAEAAGAAGLLLTDRRAPPISGAVARASAGAIEWLPIVRVTNLTRSLETLKTEGFWIVAASAEEGQSVYDTDRDVLRGQIGLVLGAEGRGVRPGVLSAADHRVWIPMRGRIDSLNVSTAAAVLLYEMARRAAADRAVRG